MSDWYWRVIAMKAAFIITCFASTFYYVRADDTIQKLPFCGPENVAYDDLVIVSTLDGKLTAFSTQNGIQAWHVETQPLLSSNLHHVEVYRQLTSGGKWVRLVPSLRGTLYSLSGETIEPLPFDADQLLSSSFKYSEDLVIAGARESLWVGVDAATGHVVYECGSGGCASEQQASANGGMLVLRRHSNTVRALDPRTGQEKWNFSVAEHQLALNRRDCVGQVSAGAPVAVAVALPEGVVAVMKPGERTPMWKQQLEAPVTAMWRLHGGSLQHIDVLWEATRSLVEGATVAPPSLYIGVHNRQLYIQESLFYASKLETAVSSKPTPWKLVNSRPLLEGGQTALSPVQADPNTLSLITLYGNTGQQGNHGFFLYLQETCDQAVQVMEDSFDGPESEQGNTSDDQPEHHHVHVHVYSLWFWWKEVLLIAISSALLMNLMIWPRLFAPKIRPFTPLPVNQEYIVVERHYERPPSERKTEYSGRYENDFTPLRCLGKGGFGVVFEAKNNIDHCSYAVKRITLPNRKSKRDRVLREVRVLAKLEHEHIVRYFNAWVEEPPPHWQEQRDAVWAKNLDGASVLLSDEYTNTARSPVPGPAPKAALRGDSVLLNIQKPIDDCVDALDFERRLNDISKRHRSQSCNDSFSIIYDDNENSKHVKNSNSSNRITTKQSSLSPPNSLSRHVTDYDESSSIVFQAPSEAKIDCSDCWKPNVQESYKSETTKSKKKKGHTRHWSLDMCVANAESPLMEPAPASKMYLYIQMQLCCRDNLHDWLLQNHTWETRGGKVKSLFSQIVSAVEYVHRAGLIHRDLKPSNILFAPDGRVKVGDFGLVTTTTDSSDDGDQETRPQLLHTNRVEISVCAGEAAGEHSLQQPHLSCAETARSIHTLLTPINSAEIVPTSCQILKIMLYGFRSYKGTLMRLLESTCSLESSLLVLHNGTELYMSPEQRRGQKYGCKVDIYSMGLILLELYHPCATDTERVSCLRAARAGVLPTTFRDSHPEEVKVLELMLSENPEQRPTARGLRCRAPLYELSDERWPDAI